MEPNVKIIVATRNIEKAIEKVNEVKISTAILGISSNISYYQMDINNIEDAAKSMKKLDPDIIVNCTVNNNPHKALNHLTFSNDLGYGHFVLWQIGLALNFMKTVRAAGLEDRFIINLSYGDVVNPILKSMDYHIDTAIGNINHIIPRMKMAIKKIKGYELSDIKIKFVGGHYLDLSISYSGQTNGCPYACQILYKNIDVTEDFEFDQLFKLCNLKVAPGKEHNQMAASDCVAIISAYIHNTGFFTHAPGVNGLPGGYPLKVYKHKLSLDLPDGITKEDAIYINQAGLKYDGIEKIEKGGVIVFSDKIYEYLKTNISFDCKYVTPDDYLIKEQELTEKFTKAIGRQ